MATPRLPKFLNIQKKNGNCAYVSNPVSKFEVVYNLLEAETIDFYKIIRFIIRHVQLVTM